MQLSRIEKMSNEELEEELRLNEAHIQALIDTNRSIENELYKRSNNLKSTEITFSIKPNVDEYLDDFSKDLMGISNKLKDIKKG